VSFERGEQFEQLFTSRQRCSDSLPQQRCSGTLPLPLERLIFMDFPQWYVVHTYSGYENKVASNILKTVENRDDLKELITAVKVPTEKVIETTEKGPKEYDRKIFPGYVMVKMTVTDETWYIVRNTRGVTGFVSPSSNKPIPLSAAEVTSMGLDLDETPEVKPEIGFVVDDLVKINSGLYTGWVGKVASIDREDESAMIILPMFGKNTEVNTPVRYITRVDFD
jgi:transcriptional antiterminator NusG